jgi:multiple sugar transport system permease protein
MTLESETDFTTPNTRYEKLRHRTSKIANDHILLVLMGPALLIITAIFVYPVFYLFRQSLYLTIPGTIERFVGLENFVTMFQSSEFWDYFVNTLIYSFGSLVISLGSGLVIALAINHVAHPRLRDAYSTLLMFSWAIPLAVVALIWKWMFTGNELGFFNMVMMDLGLIAAPIPWLSSPDFATLAVILTDAWARMPFAMLLLLAGLQSIPRHMYDAAKVDGATTFQTFRSITVQYLRPYIAIVALINWMFAFRAFAVVFPMTAGGPGTSTTIFSIHIYREGMINFNYGYASAVAVFIIGITLVVATFYVTQVMGGMKEQ